MGLEIYYSRIGNRRMTTTSITLLWTFPCPALCNYEFIDTHTHLDISFTILNYGLSHSLQPFLSCHGLVARLFVGPSFYSCIYLGPLPPLESATLSTDTDSIIFNTFSKFVELLSHD
jgi:hypothetical protein